jgi:dTDP-4-dehydrorhamnose reductase
MTAQIPESGSLLIVGMDSLVGSCLGVEASRLGIPWTGTSRRTGSRWRLDLSESHLKWQIPESSKSVAILCAAVTGIEACESDPQGTASINTTATIALADKLADEGAALVFISSSRVFPSWLDNPSETTPPAPNTEYGRQKLAVEKHLLRRHPTAKIIRLTKIISSDLPLFKNWIHFLTAKQPIHPFQDLFLSPIALNSTSRAILDIARGTASGIFHISASDAISYHQAALHIARRRGLDSALVETANAPQPNTRSSAILSCNRTIEVTGFRPLSAIENLDEALQQETP